MCLFLRNEKLVSCTVTFIGQMKSIPMYLISFLHSFSSAWIPDENLKDYSEYKQIFETKNKTKSFRRAIEEIEKAIENNPSHITLENTSIASILSTFDENFSLMESIFTSRSKVLDRFNNGHGLDYCSITILCRLLSSEQQKQMFFRIVQAFTKNQNEYIRNPIVSN